jgi:hypothetical protein
MELNTAEKTYKINASSASEKRLWVTDIKRCVAKLSNNVLGGKKGPESMTWKKGEEGTRT